MVKLNVQCMNKYIIDCKINSTKGVSCDSFDFPPGQMSVVTNRGPYIKLPWDVWVTVKTGALNKMCMLQKVCFCQFVRRVINVFRYSVKMQWFHIHNCYMYVILEKCNVVSRRDQQCVS